MPLQVAVIGTGFGASVQIPGFRRLDDVEVAAVVSGRMARAREAASRFGVSHAFDDYRTMLDAVPVDLVSVVAPPHLHYDMVMAAIERGKHVMCEKPFALSLSQAQEMLQAAERAGVVHTLDHEFRYLPARSRFRELVDQGYLGDLRLVRILALNDARANPEASPLDWWFERSKGGGLLGAIGSHYVDGLRWWFNAEVRDLAAALDALVPERPLPDGSGWGKVTADDTASLLLHLDSGAQVSVCLSAVAATRSNRVEAYGSAGSLVLEEDARLLGARKGERLQELPLPPERFPARAGEARMVGPFAELADRMVARIRGQSGPDFPTFREGVAVQAVLDAAYQAALEPRRVETPAS